MDFFYPPSSTIAPNCTRVPTISATPPESPPPYAVPSALPTISGVNTVIVTFILNATAINGEDIYLAGSHDALKNWSEDNALPLSARRYPFWEVTVELPISTKFSYKYMRKNNGDVKWEPDPNRSLTTPDPDPYHSFTTPGSRSYIVNDTWRDIAKTMRVWW